MNLVPRLMNPIGSPNGPLVLVVEDEYLVRLTAMDELEEAGFQVLEAANADAALKLLEDHAGEVQVIFSDVNMPGSLDGIALAREVHRRWPHILLLLSSGKEDVAEENIPDSGRFVPKPYVGSSLVRNISEMMQALRD